jgi:tetratricopeptide (TPR) repeat protein
MSAHRYNEAVEACKQALELEPDFTFAYLCLALTYQVSGPVDLAIEASQRMVDLGSPDGPVFLARSRASVGRRPETLARLKPLIEAARRSRRGAYNIANVFAALGDTDSTMTWLEEAYRNHDTLLTNLNSWPGFDAMRDDPRFQDLVRRIGIPSS